MPSIPAVYTDDADAVVTWEVTDNDGQNVDWASPQIAVGGAAYTSATWLGSPAPIRKITLAMPLALSLAGGFHSAYLKVPTGTDLFLGTVHVRVRA
jgi:hypothetical protein